MNDDEEVFIIIERYRLFKHCHFAACCITFSLLMTSILCVSIIVGTNKMVTSMLTVDSRWFPLRGSESCIRLMDINGDGLDDILVALTEVTAITNVIKNDKNRSQYCQTFNVETPCSGVIYGVRGYDFEILWSLRVKQSIFELICDKIDINQDGYHDCIGTGREATLIAFDPRNGKVFWNNDKIKSRSSLWNFYNPIVLSVDVDKDGMNDIVISHGGNPTIPSYVREREAGCLIVISTRNGSQIGEPFWMPNGKETYMSPVLYGNSTILFGTGGETVPGGLYSISLENILKEKNHYFTIMKSFEKGIMVPPIVLDIDYDGIDDILVSCFDGTLELICGKTMKSLWKRVFHGFEFYTTPSPGDFNNDSFVDFMIILNHGEWDQYNYSQVIILDGLTGETLWIKNNNFGEFTSPLTLQMKKNGIYQDAFIYRQRGQMNENIHTNISSVLFHGIGLQDGEISQNEHSNSSYSCDLFSLNNSIINIYLTNIEETRLIAVIYPPINNQNILCSHFEPMERSGNAIGDVNGDDILDIIDITTFITKVTSHNLNNFIAHSILTRFSLNINKIEKQIIANYQTDIYNNKIIDQNLLNLLKENNFSSTTTINNKDLYIIPKQTWNSYLGRFANNHYYRTIS